MGRQLSRILLILLAGAGLGLGVNLISPRGIALFPPPKQTLQTVDTVTLAEAKDLWLAGVIFLDARLPEGYEAGHIANSFNLSAAMFDDHFARVAPYLSPAMPLIVYCDGAACELSHEVMNRLQALGYTNTKVLVNGWSLWREAGLPTTTGDQP